MRAKLEDVCDRGSSNLRQSDVEGKNGDYPIYGASGYIGNVDFYHQELPYVAVVKDGAGVGRTMLLPAKSSVIGTMQYLLPKKNVLPAYLYYVVRYMHLEKYFSGATIPHIYFRDYKNEEFNLQSIDRQTEIVDALSKVESIISARQQQLQKLDELVKARFVELFGDPVRNSMGLPTEPMTTVCAIIDGDRGKNYPKQDEFSDTGYCLFLNAKNVTATGFSFENRMFITKEKDNALHNGKLERGDVVLTTRGTLGNLAFYDDSVPFENVRINSGMVILRMNKSVMTEVFFMEQFKLQLQSIKGKIASGSAQPQLPISTMNKIRILLAPMALQEQFAAFVEQTDKSKAAVQKSLDEAQLLFDSLMQKYFG
jgi:type I restriction enzyme S subunit